MLRRTVSVVLLVLVLVPLSNALATKAALWTDAGLFCDFEDQPCHWHWSRFVLKSATEINVTLWSSSNPGLISGPVDDADGKTEGNYTLKHAILVLIEIARRP